MRHRRQTPRASGRVGRSVRLRTLTSARSPALRLTHRTPLPTDRPTPRGRFPTAPGGNRHGTAGHLSFAWPGVRCRVVCTGIDRVSGRGHNTIRPSIIAPRVGTIRLASGPQDRRAGGAGPKAPRSARGHGHARGKRVPVARNGQPRATEGNRGQPGATGTSVGARGSNAGRSVEARTGPAAPTPNGSKPIVRGIASGPEHQNSHRG
jgi:hypothetical protein